MLWKLPCVSYAIKTLTCNTDLQPHIRPFHQPLTHWDQENGLAPKQAWRHYLNHQWLSFTVAYVRYHYSCIYSDRWSIYRQSNHLFTIYLYWYVDVDKWLAIDSDWDRSIYRSIGNQFRRLIHHRVIDYRLVFDWSIIDRLIYDRLINAQLLSDRLMVDYWSIDHLKLCSGWRPWEWLYGILVKLYNNII